MTQPIFKAERVAVEDEYYIFDLDATVVREHVYYPTRYGVEIAADLYYSKDLDKSTKHPGLVVGPPFGGVKEQGPGVYANQLAQRGYVVVAFDPASHSYSGGQPRYTGSPDTYLEDFSAAVDFIGILDYVDRNRIGALGICASGGFALGATAQDARIKAVVTSVMYDIPSLAGMPTGQDRADQLEALSLQRWADLDNKSSEVKPHYPSQAAELGSTMPDGFPTLPEFYDFYATKRGWHPHALANITEVSNLSFMNFQINSYWNEISPRPTLLITTKTAHSRAFSETAYEQLQEPKELYIAPAADHVDFYDRVDLIPFDKIDAFFKENLK
ncbi:alpha/beta hydrolase [Streptococcus merionis]|uniref:alpha/beta hydrolase n=1 Tax=Streptococcus merionis TaxID=400065 RepID=UPI0026F36F9B|nr:alpha/beta hydrolase [Streptococcus merionis]